MPGPATFHVVGDLHRHWRSADREFLERADSDLALFVGDLGDEDVDMVQQIADIRAEKVVLLGNHDAWQSFSRRRPTSRLRESLAALGEDHLAYDVREAPRAGVSVIGARPFSWGGPSLRSPEVYDELYQVRDRDASAARIYDAARRAQHRDLVVLAHNGPTGLSREPQDIYGKDFGHDIGGDWGDADLQEAIDRIVRSGWRVPCVIAGHMHDRLMHPRGAERCRFVRRGGTVYVNPAVVPRIRSFGDGATVAYYVRMQWADGELLRLQEIWVDPEGRVREAIEPDVREL